MNDFFKTKTAIIEWLERYQIKQYELIEDEHYGYVVDVHGHVVFSDENLKWVPVKFNVVEKNFICAYTQLDSIAFAPKEVKRDFHCGHNNLKTLKGGPQIVGGSFACDYNLLESLEFGPEEVGAHYYCDRNHLRSLKFSPENINGTFNCSSNLLETLEGCPKFIRGDFRSENNLLKNIAYFPETYSQLFLNNNPHLNLKFKEIVNEDIMGLRNEGKERKAWLKKESQNQYFQMVKERIENKIDLSQVNESKNKHKI